MVSTDMVLAARSSIWLASAIAGLAVLLGACSTSTPTDALPEDSGPQNEAPAIEPIAGQRTTLNEPVDVLVTISDEDPDTVFLAATVDDPSLVPDGNVAVLGSGAERTLRIAPAAGATGTTRVEVAARDDVGDDVTASFELSIEVPFQGTPLGVTAGDGATGDWFGYAVAIAGDTAIIGAYYDDNGNGSDAGAAYVFQRVDGAWTERQKLTATDGAADDQFGLSVAIDGDTAIIGAYLDDNGNGVNAGAAYLYQRVGGVWTELVKLTASDGASTDWFGVSVAIEGDRALVGANYDDNDRGSGAGAAYVFQRMGGTWPLLQKLAAADGAAGDRFGVSVTIDGDYAAVGAFQDDGPAIDSGSAYLFQRAGGGWNQIAKVVADDGAENDYFGRSVAIDGAILVVGADRKDSFTGAAYVVER